MRVAVATGTVFALLIIVLGCPTIESQPVSYVLSADQLYSEYEANEVAADSKYEGRVVVVYGGVRDISTSWLAAATAAYSVKIGSDSFPTVNCHFHETHKQALARISKGQNVRIKGTVLGLGLGAVNLFPCALE